MKFMLDGCDISFVAEAPEDITLKQLLKQTDKIRPYWCACGIRSLREDEKYPAEIRITYEGIEKIDEYANCDIVEGSKEDEDCN